MSFCHGKSSAHPSIISGQFDLPLPGVVGLGLVGFPKRWHLVAEGLVCPKIWEKLALRPYFCYHAPCEKIWLREEDRLEDFTRPKRLQNLVCKEAAKAAG